MGSHINGFTCGFILVLIFLNAPFLVAADTSGFKSGSGNFTNPEHTHSYTTSTETVILHPNTSDPPMSLSVLPITTSTSSVPPIMTPIPPPLPSATSTTPGVLAAIHNNLSSGAIAGIVVGTVVPLLLIGVFFIYRRKRQRQHWSSHDGPIDITGNSDPIGSPVYEKRFIPSPFLTDKEARHLGCDLATRRIGPKFITADQLDSEKADPYYLSDPSPAHTHASLPVLHSNSGYSPEPPEDSRTITAQRPSTASSEDTLTEETPSHCVSPYPRGPSEEAAVRRLGRA